VARADLGRQANALTTKEEHNAFREAHVPDHRSFLRAEEERLAQICELRLDAREARPDARPNVLPVVEACAAHLTRVEGESEGLYQVELRPDGEARAARVAHVPVDLRLDEHDVRVRRGRSGAHRGSVVRARRGARAA
jgi:hypothetical protein